MARVETYQGKLPMQLIHGRLHYDNCLVADTQDRVTGVLDLRMERKGEQLRHNKTKLGPSDLRIVPYSELFKKEDPEALRRLYEGSMKALLECCSRRRALENALLYSLACTP